MESKRLGNWLRKNNFTLDDFINDPSVCARYVTYIRKKANEFKKKYHVIFIRLQDQPLFDEFLR